MRTLGVNGSSGQMGTAVVDAAVERADVTISFGIDPETDVGLEVPVYSPDEVSVALDEHDPDAVVDFTTPEATETLARRCAETDVPLVVGTTGFEEDRLSVLQAVSDTIPLLKATNFSRGIQGLLRALGPALEVLDGYDVELLETHHNRKRDAPSGTARTILETVAEHREFEAVYGREGIQPRDEDEIGVLVRRAGDIRGEHEVTLAGNDEVLTVSHRAEDRGVFASGAIDAAVWLSDRTAGWYDFGDVVTAEPTDG